jgi:hypothetical protein
MHPTHRTRYSDASTFDEICVLCGVTDTSNDQNEPCTYRHVSKPQLDVILSALWKARERWVEEQA